MKRIIYLDVNGRKRVVTLIKELEGLVKWHKDLPESLASLYELDDGGIVQIPHNAWSNVTIIEETNDD